MLTNLRISNYALIENLEIEFSGGLSVITGETGAGKSILLGAVSLILGSRADTQVLFDKNRKCYIEGSFNIDGYGFEEFFAVNEIDYDKTTILRREINQQGKSRAFINDTPVKLNVIKELGDRLVDIHSQYNTLLLNEREFQLRVVDSYAKNVEEIRKYKEEYAIYLAKISELNKLKEQEKQAKADRDYYQYLFDEIEKANLKPNEQQLLEEELEILNNAEEIKKNLTESTNILSDSDINIVGMLREIEGKISKVVHIHHKTEDLQKRINNSRIELNDISYEMNKLAEEIKYTPDRIEQINDRLDVIYGLEHKHSTETIEGLMEVRDKISDKLEKISSMEDNILKLNELIKGKESLLNAIAERMSKLRAASVKPIENAVVSHLETLGMPYASLKIEQQRLTTLTNTGKDRIEFLFSANKGGELKDISKVASGGELSRLMLSIKSIISQRNLLPTIIFDEIDIGVSGEIAGKAANLILDVSKQMQVIVITHQPQIAAKADMHYYVYKMIGKDSTHSHIRKLTKEERIEEIAMMISGNKESKSANETAKELMGN